MLVVIWVKVYLLAVSPKPNWPNWLYPVPHKVPSFFNIKVWLPPQQTDLILSVLVVTWVKVVLSVLSPKPNSPSQL